MSEFAGDDQIQATEHESDNSGDTISGLIPQFADQIEIFLRTFSISRELS